METRADLARFDLLGWHDPIDVDPGQSEDGLHVGRGIGFERVQAGFVAWQEDRFDIPHRAAFPAHASGAVGEPVRDSIQAVRIRTRPVALDHVIRHATTIAPRLPPSYRGNPGTLLRLV